MHKQNKERYLIQMTITWV